MAALPTPPLSDCGSAGPCAVSEPFNEWLGPPDLVLVSLDAVIFHVHYALLLGASGNLFNGLPAALAAQDDSRAPKIELDGDPLPIAFMPEDESILDIIVHAIYGRALSAPLPSAVDLEAAGYALVDRYAVHFAPFAGPGFVLYDAAIALAPHEPLDTYILAARFDAEQLAVACSALLLTFPLPCLTEAHARRMGVHFLCRLLGLHCTRVAALRSLLAVPPAPHTPSPVCSEARMGSLANCWQIAAAAILCDASAGTPSSHLEDILRPLLPRLGCRACHKALSTRISELTAQWSAVKVRGVCF